VLVEHLAWTRRYRRSATAATPAQMAFGPFVAPTVRRCRGFELRSSYSRLAAPPLPICVEGQTTAAELDELLTRLERGDFVRKAEAGVARGVDTSHLSQITRLRCSRTADEVRFEVAYRLSRVSGAVLELVQRGLVLRLVRASVWVA